MAIKNNVKAESIGLAARLTNRADKARRAGERRLQQGTEIIAAIARDFAPVDEGNLEAAIKTRKFLSGRHNVHEIYIDETAPGSNGAETVEKYAVFAHEAIYNLGSKSSIKDSSIGGNGEGYLYGGKVGPFFLDRAVESYGPKLQKQVKDAIKRGLK